MLVSPDEKWIIYKHINENYNPSEQTNDAIRNIYKREYKRLLGNNQFDNFVYLEKSSQFWIELFNKNPPFKYL